MLRKFLIPDSLVLLTGMALIVLSSNLPFAGTGLHTVFLIVMENTNWSKIEGNDDAPYINTVLLPNAAYASQYYNPPGVHPSEPNYLWLEAGTGFGIRDDANPDINHQHTDRHLVALLGKRNIAWKSYQEGINGTDCPLSDAGLMRQNTTPWCFLMM